MFNRLFFHIVFLTSLIIAGSCASVKPQKHKKYKFDDDLTNFRPSYQISDTLYQAVNIKLIDTLIIPEKHINSSLDAVLVRISENNKDLKIPVYRVQVFSNIDREKAKQAKRDVYQKFLDVDVSIDYYSPNFRIRVGYFIHRLNAYRMYIALKDDFKNVLIVPEKVRISKIK